MNYDFPVNYDCPECLAGKCGNCHGDAWNFEEDEPTVCYCWEKGHPVQSTEGAARREHRFFEPATDPTDQAS